MPELSVDVKFTVYCSTCGTGLCEDTIVDYSHRDAMLKVDCPNCREKANEEGYDDGFEAGYKQGLEEGRKEIS